MLQVERNLFKRGKSGVLYCRVRIPQSLLRAYSGRKEIARSLRTSSVPEARKRLAKQLAAVYKDFERQERKLKALGDFSPGLSRDDNTNPQLTVVSDEQVQALAGNWIHQAMLGDDYLRSRGLDEQEFAELDEQLRSQRKEYGRLLAMGQTAPVLPALHAFMHLLGVDMALPPERQREVAFRFLEAVTQAIDLRLQRQEGQAKPSQAVEPKMRFDELKSSLRRQANGPSWEDVFQRWNRHVDQRPKSTIIAAQTPWRDLERVARRKGIAEPGQVTKELVIEFVEEMVARGLATDTVNDRLNKVRAIYKIAVGRNMLDHNPAVDVVGQGKSGLQRRKKGRLSFDAKDIETIFSCPIYTDAQLRSQGQSKEASYWIPLLMHYAGARTEEVAGLAIADVVHDPQHGFYLNLVDRPDAEDAGLFDDDDGSSVPKKTTRSKDPQEATDSAGLHARTLKNAASIRRVPVAQELIDLGLLRYIDWVKQQGEVALFPTLKPDWHNKLSGSFSKFFGRLKVSLGITDRNKVLYSFRHTMKDSMEKAEVPSKYLKRLMGHTAGDGHITDGYGSDLPLDLLFHYFRTIKFHPIPAKPWQPGKGTLRLR
jgi:integrase